MFTERNTNPVTLEKFGAKYDGTDETQVLQDAINYSNTNKVTVLMDGRELLIKGKITLPPGFISLKSSTPSTGYASTTHYSSKIVFDGNPNTYVFTSNGSKIMFMCEDIKFSALKNKDFSYNKNLNLFENCDFGGASILYRNKFTGFKNVFYNCTFFGIAKVTQCTVYSPVEAVFNRCSIGDTFIVDNYFSGAGLKDDASKVYYPDFIKDSTLLSYSNITGNWFEFFRKVIPTTYGVAVNYSNNIFDYCYDFHFRQNNCCINNNIFSRCCRTQIINNMQLFGTPIDEVLNNTMDIITFYSGPVAFTSNVFCYSSTANTVVFKLLGYNYNGSTGSTDLGRMYIKNNTFSTFPTFSIPTPLAITNFPSVDIDCSEYLTPYPTIMEPNLMINGFTYKFAGEAETLKTVYETNAIVSQSNGVVVGFGKNLIKRYEFWNFGTNAVTHVNKFTVQINKASAGWVDINSEDIPLEVGKWYKFVNHTVRADGVSDNLVEVQLFNGSTYVSTIRRTNGYFLVPSGVTKCNVKLRINTAGIYTFKGLGLYKFDGKTINKNVVLDAEGNKFRTRLDTSTLSLDYEPFN
ncbi:hypothetical protein [Peribacillus frigoritolerans]|uniref:hypothetical protein n=1 Tax=Peribacillus frigoritolerans TaxID=450367 RepID=UPI002B05F3E9|nr:hypothetical protein [Peribacillus frigoritolerans]MEA3573908.1 hypothetical protein [Peribacillus frigoritolerans]